jgi:hypothetical protein
MPLLPRQQHRLSPEQREALKLLPATRKLDWERPANMGS